MYWCQSLRLIAAVIMRWCECLRACAVRMKHDRCDNRGDGVNYDPKCVSFECSLVGDRCEISDSFWLTRGPL